MLGKNSCQIVAEVSGNHAGKLETALEIVKMCAKAGVNYVKFQTYTADTMTLDISSPDFAVSSDHPLWGGRSLYSLYQQAHTPWQWHAELFELARTLGVTPFSTPFDASAVDFLESLGASMYKIASLEIVDTPLIRYVAQTGKPLIISTGTASLSEIDEAVGAAESGGCSQLTLLVCTSSYPASPSDVHLHRMETLRNRYQTLVGLSDHTLGLGASIAAVALGASLIERHVTLDRSDGGLDAAFSLEPAELDLLVREVRAASESLGSGKWNEIGAEDESRRLRRSLYIVQPMKRGDIFSLANLRSIRPGAGLAPKYLDQVLGRRIRKDVAGGTPLSLDDINFDE